MSSSLSRLSMDQAALVGLNQSVLPLRTTTFKGAGCVLSNFFPCSVTIFNITFTSTEQAYQYRKALFFQDLGLAQQVLGSNTASQCKAVTKSLVDRSWDAIKVSVLEHIVRAKLAQVPAYRQALLAAEDLIIESVPGDTFWSCGLLAREAVNTFPAQWPGRNVMGRLHMMLRSELLDTGAHAQSSLVPSVPAPPVRVLSPPTKRVRSLLDGLDSLPASREGPVTVPPSKKARRHAKVPCPLQGLVPCGQPSVDRVERHLGRQHSLACLVSDKGVSNQDRCKEVSKFLLSLAARFGLTSLQALLGKLQASIRPSDPLRAYSVQPLQLTLVRGYHHFLGDMMPVGDINVLAPNCVAALSYWVNVVCLLRLLPRGVVCQLLGVTGCSGTPSVGGVVSLPSTKVQVPSVVVSAPKPLVGSRGTASSSVASAGVSRVSYAAVVATPRSTPIVTSSQASAQSTPVVSSQASAATKPAPKGEITCRDIRYYNPDGTLRAKPLLDNPSSSGSVEYGTDCHFHAEIIADRLRTNQLNKLVGTLPASKKFGMLVTCFCFPSANPELLRSQIQADPRMYVCIGLHPKVAQHGIRFPGFVDHVRGMIKSYPKVVGIGEVGIDLSCKGPSESVQTKVLSQFTKLADETGLPLVIHCRDAVKAPPRADRLCVDVVGKILSPQHRVYRHCLTGYREASEWLNRFPKTVFGVNGKLLKPGSGPVEEAVIRLPLKSLVLESDAPFLHPNGSQVCNTPVTIFDVADRIAQLKKVRRSVVLSATSENADRLYE